MLTGAQDTAHHFNRNNLTGAVGLALILCSALTVFLNSRFFLRVAHSKRIMCGLISSASGLFIYGITHLSNDSRFFAL